MEKKASFLICSLVITGIILMLINSCKKDDNNNPTPTVLVPVLTTSAVSDITSSTATCGGNITSDGGSAVIARGVCWSIGTTPTIADSITTDGMGAGAFTSTLTGLLSGSSGTTYFVRAYATTSNGTGYGNALSFTTKPGGSAGTVTDIDGNVYNTVIIGTQVWMVENLKVTKYRNGNLIPNITDATEWSNLTTGACCDYENTPSNSTIYGTLYNWYAVSDIRNIAPTGWHMPTDAEWTILTNYLGGEGIAGGKLKEKGLTHWNDQTWATNEYGFTALPGGYRYRDGTYSSVGGNGYWWSSTETSATYAWTRSMYYASSVGRSSYSKICGFSVRCLKDN